MKKYKPAILKTTDDKYYFYIVKKITAIFFLMVYAASSIGATVYTHYCMNTHVGTSLWHSDKDKCGKCGMTEKQGKGCCNDEQKLIKLSAEHTQSVVADISFPDFSSAIINHAPAYQGELFSTTDLQFYGAHSPPYIRLKRNILYNVFRI